MSTLTKNGVAQRRQTKDAILERCIDLSKHATFRYSVETSDDLKLARLLYWTGDASHVASEVMLLDDMKKAVEMLYSFQRREWGL